MSIFLYPGANAASMSHQKIRLKTGLFMRNSGKMAADIARKPNMREDTPVQHREEYLMKFFEVEEAREMPGVRLVQTVGFPGPWGQAVKKMFKYKSIDFVPVAQYAGKDNKALVDWIGTRNAPVIVADEIRPLSAWIDQIIFTETYTSTPPLLPSDSGARALVFGIINELAGEWGYGWCRRLMMFQDTYVANPSPEFRASPIQRKLDAQYGYSDTTVAAAPQRCVDILNMLTTRLKAQQAKGRKFLIGPSLTAVDIYWATFSTMLQPLTDEWCTMSPELRENRMVRHPLILAAKDPILLEHRKMMYRDYLGPLEF